MKLTKKNKKKLATIAALLIAVLLGVATKEEVFEALNLTISQQAEQISSQIDGTYTVTRVVDGDTLEINYQGQETKVRLIGVDTPESVHPDAEKNTEFGKTASEYTKQLVEGKPVTLEFDVQQTDQYGRLLAYVYIDGEMLNKKLLQEGYAQVDTFPPNVKYVDEFTQIQEQARENKKGLWAYEAF